MSVATVAHLEAADRSDAIERHARTRTWSGCGALIGMAAPGLLYFLVFHYLPLLGLVIAFKDFTFRDGILNSPWIGLANFHRLFAHEEFLGALRNTIVISLLKLASGFVAPVVLALMLNELRVRWFKSTVQTLTYLPHLFSWVILAGVVLGLFSNDGPVNALIRATGAPAAPFLTSGPWFVATLVITAVWQSAGYAAVIYLAAMTAIDPSLYEAGRVDGAGRFRLMWHVTLPGLRPMMVTLLIISLGHVLNAGFDQIYNMYNPAVREASDVLDTYLLRRMVAMDYGLAASAGMFKSVVGMAMVVAANAIARRVDEGSGALW